MSSSGTASEEYDEESAAIIDGAPEAVAMTRPYRMLALGIKLIVFVLCVTTVTVLTTRIAGRNRREVIEFEAMEGTFGALWQHYRDMVDETAFLASASLAAGCGSGSFDSLDSGAKTAALLKLRADMSVRDGRITQVVCVNDAGVQQFTATGGSVSALPDVSFTKAAAEEDADGVYRSGAARVGTHFSTTVAGDSIVAVRALDGCNCNGYVVVAFSTSRMQNTARMSGFEFRALPPTPPFPRNDHRDGDKTGMFLMLDKRDRIRLGRSGGSFSSPAAGFWGQLSIDDNMIMELSTPRSDVYYNEAADVAGLSVVSCFTALFLGIGLNAVFAYYCHSLDGIRYGSVGCES